MRILALTVGNTTLYCALFVNGTLKKYLRQPLAEIDGPNPLQQKMQRAIQGKVDAVALTSVVPALTRPLARQLEGLTGHRPKVLSASSRHGLTIGYHQPRKLGADRVAAALGARAIHPKKNLLIIDCGTASTVTAVSAKGRILGGAILPGVTLWSDLLYQRTAQLPRVAGKRPRHALGRSPTEGIASGIHFGHAGALRELIAKIRAEAFGSGGCLVLGTGGNAELFRDEGLFDRLEPNLVLKGLAAFAQQP